jgi:hypothetical protein
MSGEHRVSKSLFDGDSISVHGFSWCKEKPVTIPLLAATAKILCITHNNALSDVDAAGARAFRTFHEMFRICDLQSKRPQTRWSSGDILLTVEC